MNTEEFLRKLNARSPWTRAETLSNAEEIPKAIRLIGARACISDPNPWVRRVAADQLAVLGSTHDRYRLLLASHDKSWDVRSSTVDAMAGACGSSAKARLAELLLSDPHFVVRRDAAWALAKFDSETEKLLQSALCTERNEVVRCAIFAGLYKLGDQKSLLSLLSYLSNQDPLVRDNVVNHIRLLKIQTPDRDLVREQMDQLLERETNAGIRGDAKMTRDEI